MNMPSTRRTLNMINSMISGASSTSVAHSIIPELAPVKARSWLKVDDARMISNTMAVTRTDPANALTRIFQVRTR